MSLLCLLREDFTRNQVLYSCTHEEVIKIHLDGEREREKFMVEQSTRTIVQGIMEGLNARSRRKRIAIDFPLEAASDPLDGAAQQKAL